MEALIIYGYKLTNREVAGLPVGVLEAWIDNGWLIGSDNSNDWYFGRVIGTDEWTDLEIEPEEFFSRPTKEYFEQLQEHFEFFSSKQLNYYLILREQEYNYCIDDLIAGGRS